MPQVVLVTGATGFLGSHLCRALIERGHRVVAFRRRSSDVSRLGALAGQVRWHLAPDELDAPFSGPGVPDAVIHCAALYGRRGESPVQMLEANTVLPVRLYDIAARRGVPLFLNTDTVLDPALNLYALSKHHAAQWLMRAGGPTRVLNLKVQHFYGPGDDPTKFITGLIAQCLADVPEIRLTDGRQQRDFIYVSDVVSAMFALLECKAPGSGVGVSPAIGAAVPGPDGVGQDAPAAAPGHPVQNRPGGGFASYEIGSGHPVRVRELVELIHRLTGSRSRLLFGAVPYRPDEPMLTRADTSALRELGWRPRVQLPEGLARTVEELKLSKTRIL
jgi:nucleoside-diphosphate-sugar epimerase